MHCMSSLATPASENEISEFAAAIRRRMPARQIWLFGSMARGEATADSDVDLLVVLPDDHGIERPCLMAKLAIGETKTCVPTDVVVITESQAANPSPLIEHALREGRLLK